MINFRESRNRDARLLRVGAKLVCQKGHHTSNTDRWIEKGDVVTFVGLTDHQDNDTSYHKIIFKHEYNNVIRTGHSYDDYFKVSAETYRGFALASGTCLLDLIKEVKNA